MSSDDFQVALICDRTGNIIKFLSSDAAHGDSPFDAGTLFELFSFDQADRVDQLLKGINQSGIALDWEFQIADNDRSKLVLVSGAEFNASIYIVIQPPDHLDDVLDQLSAQVSSDKNRYLSAILGATGVSSRARSIEFLTELTQANNELINSQRDLSLSKAKIEKMLEAEQIRSQQLSAFYDAASLVVGANDIDSIVNAIVAAITDAPGFGVKAAAVHLAQPDGSFAATGSPGLDSTRHKYVSQISQESIQTLMRLPATLVEASQTSDNPVEQLLFRLEVSMGLFVPLRAAKSRLGIIAILFSEDATVSDEIVHLIEAFAAMAATAIRSELMKEELSALATTDSLTGLLNRRAFLASFNAEMRRADRKKLPVSAMIADVDHFKRVNDKYGHMAGDIVLSTLAMAIKQDLRTEDLVCRYGGEEFAIVLPDTPVETALAIAERLRLLVAKTCIFFEGVSIPLTISVGVAPAILGASVETALKYADRALYQAKNAGRNRVICWRDQEMNEAIQQLEIQG